MYVRNAVSNEESASETETRADGMDKAVGERGSVEAANLSRHIGRLTLCTRLMMMMEIFLLVLLLQQQMKTSAEDYYWCCGKKKKGYYI